MKVLGINGSPKKEGNTYLAIKTVMDILQKDGFDTEILHIGGRAVRGCTDCRKCSEHKDKECVIKDYINDAIAKLTQADVIILGSPVYFSNVTPELKAMIDRAGRVCRANDYLLKNKIGVGVTVARRSGKNSVIAALNYFFLIEQMIVPGSTYWNGLIGKEPGDIFKDKEGLENLNVLAQNISHLAKKLHST